MTEQDHIEEVNTAEIQAAVQDQPVEGEMASQQAAPPQDDQSVNWKEARAKLQEQRELLSVQQAQIEALYKALAHGGAKAEASPEPEPDDQLADDDYVSLKHLKKIGRKIVEEELEQRTLVQKTEDSKRRVLSEQPNAIEIIDKYLTPITTNNKALIEGIAKSPDPYGMALRMAMATPEYQRDHGFSQPPAAERKVEKILENSKKPVSNQASGSLKSEAGMFSNLSTKEIWSLSQQYARQSP